MQNVLPEAGEGWRHVVYTCYQPRSLATDADLANKRAAWDNFDVTTHWPAANVSVHDTFENKELGELSDAEADQCLRPTAVLYSSK